MTTTSATFIQHLIRNPDEQVAARMDNGDRPVLEFDVLEIVVSTSLTDAQKLEWLRRLAGEVDVLISRVVSNAAATERNAADERAAASAVSSL
jgi:hypothetical protein